MTGTSKDDVYGRACAMYGFLNVAGVYVDNPDNVKYLEMKNFKLLER